LVHLAVPQAALQEGHTQQQQQQQHSSQDSNSSQNQGSIARGAAVWEEMCQT
jgi:hypothetical protein